MTAPTADPVRSGRDVAPTVSAVRTRWGLVTLLFVLAAFGWWWTTIEMRGMDNGPWSDLGAFGWFLSIWIVMMAAMMFPSVAPTVALYSRMTRQRSPLSPLIFTAGYLVTWAVAGILAYAIRTAIDATDHNVFAWDHAGRWVAGTTLLVAAAYQLTPLKDACLGKCRSPLGFLMSSWRDGSSGALKMGTVHGVWCVGCCWALMAALFALGIMSVGWMAIVAGIIAVEKTLPWRRFALHGTALLLLILGTLLLVAPSTIPGFTTPRQDPMSHMPAMTS